ncbi:MAG TPA: thioredoxin family protein [Polyangiaceae bacterium]|nr:thioredoxin family protein [Polyangiaceae bacterium]
MAVPSNMLPLGTALPSFRLKDAVSGRTVASDELLGRPSVVAFICNHCPYVKHLRAGLADFGRYCADHGVALVGISSNDPASYPDDAPDKMALEAKTFGYAFPYLFDDTQAVARAFDAACTPEFYVFDLAGKLAYRGQFDDARPKNALPVTGADVRAAVEALLSGGKPSPEQKPSIGCSIKWKAG